MEEKCNAMVQAALELGFAGCVPILTEKIPFEPGFLVCCEENTCGKYNANYACPPACGTPAQMEARVRRHSHGLLLQTVWEIDDPMNGELVRPCKAQHNRMERQLRKKFAELGQTNGFWIAASGCDFCKPCTMVQGLPCHYPDEQMSCMSAYCIFVRELCRLCDLEYDMPAGLVPFFGMYIFTPSDAI